MHNSRHLFSVFALVSSLLLPIAGSSAELSPESASKVDALVQTAAKWAADPVVVNAVKARNAAAPANLADMNQAKWSALSVLDPILRELSRNDAAKALRAVKQEAVTEMFLNAADGTKVALLAKTTSWSHKGSGKHDVPMKGESWKGSVEIDDSTGMEQMQVAVPVLDGGKPVGSLVIGIGLANLR